MEIHRCRFVEHQPAAINALDFTPPTIKRSRLAVGRANGNIEIWDPSYNFRLEKTIPGGEGQSVESIAWAHQSIVTDQDEDDTPEEIEAELKRLLNKAPRLFSSGLNPYIVEWDTTTLTVKRSVDSNGGAVWCLAVNSSGTRLAAGCEDGCIRLFDIEDGRLEYMRSFAPQKGRVLSVAWSPYNDTIVSGGTDSALRTWDVSTGQTLQRMIVDRVQNEKTLVWSVAVLKDGTLVSGDSLGHIMFWNGKTGTMKQTIRSHAADILALAVSKDGQQVFSAGVDCKLTAYRKTLENGKKSARSIWATVESRQYHSHDIRALALCENDNNSTIVSGGVDVQLVACPAKQFPKHGQLRLPPFPQKYLVSLSKSHRLVMGTYFNSLSLWRLGKAEHMDIEDSKIGIPDMLEPHRQVLQLQLKADCNITSSALSENAKWIIVSDIENIRLFHLTEGVGSTGQIRPKKMRGFDAALGQYLSNHNLASGAHHVLFTPGSDKIIVVTVESRILIIDLRHWEQNTFEVLGEFSHHRGFDSEGNVIENCEAATVITAAVSVDGQWLATGDDKNRIHVFNLDSLKHHIELPHSYNHHTVLSFNDFRPNELFVGQASNEFYIYNVEYKRLTDWSKANKDFTGTPLTAKRECIRGVTYNPANKNEMIVYASSYMYLIDMSHKPVLAPVKNHKRKHQKHGNDKQRIANESPILMKVSDRYQQILYCDFMNDNSLVMIERPKFSVLEKLPPSFYKSRFST